MEDTTFLRSNRHSCYNLRYHLILVTKYRKPAISDEVLKTIRGVVENVFNKSGCELIALNHDKDHIHILFIAPPQIQLSSMINNLKTVTSRLVRRDHKAWLSKFYWEPIFWSRSYYIGSVGDTTAAIVEMYIQNQGKK